MDERFIREELLRLEDKNIFILAGAGAGKSSIMVNRLMEQAKLGNQSFKETVAITFTNKAAMELEEKLMRALDQLPPSQVNDRLKQEKNELTIETIHSFCQKILQERPIEAGLSPNFTVMEEGEAKELFRSIVLDTFYGPFIEEVDEASQRVLEGQSIESYFNLLFSQALHSELGLEEKVFMAEEEVMDQDHASFIKEVQDAILSCAKHIYPGIVYKGVSIFKKPNQAFMGLSLKDLILAHWKKAGRMEAVITALFTKASANTCLKKLQDIYSEAEMNKQVDIAEENFVHIVEEHVYELFEAKILPLIESESLSIDTIFTSTMKEDILSMDPVWHEQLEELIQEKSVKGLYEHLFYTPLRRMSVRDLLTGGQQAAYDDIDENNLKELYQFLKNRQAYSGPSVQMEDLAEVLSIYHKKALMYDEDGKALKGILQSLFYLVMEAYNNEKLQRNVVTNNDLLKKTYDLLHKEEVRQYFHHKYRYLYVDECQDTDPLQTKILFYLTSEKMPGSMDDARPRKGSLFLVGDPKQSIYRFRNADLRIYEQIRQIALGSEDWFVANLQWNFRSHPHLIDWFNTKFPPMFAAESSLSKQPDYEAMEASGKAVSHEPVVYKLENKEEAESIASWIAEQKQLNQAFKYEDVLIITPINKSVKKYVDVLKNHGIPTSFSGSIIASDFPELIRLTDLLDYIGSPNRFKRMKVLGQNWHIPFSLIHEYEGREEKEKQDERFAPIHKAMDQLDYYRTLARKLSSMELLTALVYEEQVGIFDPEISDVDYKSARSILTTFIEKVRQRQPITHIGMLSQMKQLLDENIEYELQADDTGEAVQIMNIHKTKGLEAKYVFLVAPEKRFYRDSTHIVTRNHWEEEIEFSLFTRGYPVGAQIIQYCTESFYQKIADEDEHEEAERIRQLYVAATRAEEMLVITESDQEGDYTWNDLLDDDIPYLSVQASEEEEVEKKYIQVQPIPPVQDETEEEGKEKLAAYRSYEKVSPSDASFFEKERIIEEEAKNFHQSNLPFKGPIWGNIVHQGMECFLQDRSRSFDDTLYYETLVKGLSQYELNDDELFHFGQIKLTSLLKRDRLQALLDNDLLRQTLQEALEKCMHHPFFQSLLDAHHTYTELPFTAFVAAEDAAMLSLKEVGDMGTKPVLINGVIDLVLQSKSDANVFTIVDYKTDYIREGESKDAFHLRLKNGYTHQLRAYETVLGQIFQEDSDVTLYIYALQTNEFIEIKSKNT